MAVKKNVTEADSGEIFIEKAKDFWGRYQKQLTAGIAVIVLVVGGFLGYRNFIQKPNQEKAVDAMYKAEEYYRLDSLQKALHGDGLNQGFIKVIDKYGGTKAGNLARFYAGDCFLRSGDYNNAVKYLKDFSTSQKQVQARAYKLLGDAYSELGRNEEAVSSYKKAASHFTEDKRNSAEYLFFAAALAEKTGDAKEAISLYKKLKEEYPGTQQGNDADKYLARLGVYN